MRVSANVDEVHDVGRVVDTPWLALDILVSDVVAARRRIAEAQAEEARLLAGAVGLIADRTEVLRQEAQQQGAHPAGRTTRTCRFGKSRSNWEWRCARQTVACSDGCPRRIC